MCSSNLEVYSFKVKVRKKTVDATLTLTHVPSTKAPEYASEEGVNLVPINKLADIKEPWKRYVVIGAGKTGLDALLYLLDNGVDPEKIVWIVSNDCWYMSRDDFEGGDAFKSLHKIFPKFFGVILESENVDEVYQKSEAEGIFYRLDKNIWPTKMRAATVSSKEMKKCLTIKNIVRLGRIERIEKEQIVFKQGGTIPTDADTLHVDCSASGTNFPPVKEKIFDGNKINLMMVQMPQPCTSAAMIAALENK